jgi:hypothetical protein
MPKMSEQNSANWLLTSRHQRRIALTSAKTKLGANCQLYLYAAAYCWVCKFKLEQIVTKLKKNFE